MAKTVKMETLNSKTHKFSINYAWIRWRKVPLSNLYFYCRK